ncbi:MAG: T9SS type A sorting domain-containing protein [Candidatus Marinimicrobia bacterium]|nr:T9SS type A sorting domain-containing protein [Candidatus Neomarinimicrobiota bacterium]
MRITKLLCITLFLLLVSVVKLSADSCLPDSRRVDWKKSGLLPDTDFSVDNWIYVNDYTGSDYNKILAAITNANQQPGNTIIYFQSQSYHITAKIDITPLQKNKTGNILFLGNLSPDTLTTLVFEGLDDDDDCILLRGWWSGDTALILDDVQKGDQVLYYDDTGNISLETGDWIKFCEPEFDDDYNKSKAEFIGQITQITAVGPGAVSIQDEAAKNYAVSNDMWLQEFRPVMNIGFENLKVERDNSSKGYGSTFYFDRAVNCWLKGVESYNCTGYHIQINHSTHIQIDGCFINKATNYDSNEGSGYGIVLGNATTNCRIENNVFQKTRHAMLVGRGANSNVFDYNYSRDAEWDFDNLNPGDVRLHGRYPFANLFEGNSVDFIYGDETHGDNGPFNTFLRNKVRNDNLTLYNSDSSNVFTNYIKGDHTFIDEPSWAYQLVHPEAKKSKNIIRDNNCPDISYIYDHKPSFFIHPTDTFPPYETNSQNSKIPADMRWEDFKAERLISPLYYNPPNFAPLLQNPIPNLTIEEDSPIFTLNLSHVFIDHDNTSGPITKSILYVSNDTLFTLQILDEILYLQPNLNQYGTSMVYLQAESDGMTANDTFSVTINPVNDAPTGMNGTVTILEDSLVCFQKSDFPYTDIEMDSLRAIQILTLPQKGAAYYHTLPLSADQLVTDFSVFCYRPEPNDFGPEYAAFSYRLMDAPGAFSDSAYQMALKVENVDDPPYINRKTGLLEVTEDSTEIFILLDSVFSDIDNEDSLITHAILSISDSSLCEATLFQDSLEIILKDNAFGNSTIIVVGISNFLSVTDTLQLNVSPVNDAPFSRDTAVTLGEDTRFYFLKTNFPFEDIEQDSLVSIRLQSLPGSGHLYYHDEPAVINTNLFDFAALSFLPEKNRIGRDYAQFSFQVVDDEFGISDSIYTLTIHVEEIDDPPIVLHPLPDLFFHEDAGDTILNIRPFFFDPDDSVLSFSVLQNSPSQRVSATLADSMLSLSFAPNQYGASTLIVGAASNAYTVTDTFSVFVSEVNDLPAPFSLLLPLNRDTIDIFHKDSITFCWESSADPDPGDTLLYILVLSDTQLFTPDTLLSWPTSGYRQNPSPLITFPWYVTVTSHMDTVLSTDTFTITLKNGPVSIGEETVPEKFQLSQNFPNPFNSSTILSYSLALPTEVQLYFYNSAGKLVDYKHFPQQAAGYYQFHWKVPNLPSGLYFYKIVAGNYIKIKKCLLIK